MSRIRVAFYQPGEPVTYPQIENSVQGFTELLGAEPGNLEFSAVRWGGCRYSIVCLDYAYKWKLPEHRRIVASIYDGWKMRGPFFVTAVVEDRHLSIDDTDEEILAAALVTLETEVEEVQ
jgi:hypothetical protein